MSKDNFQKHLSLISIPLDNESFILKYKLFCRRMQHARTKYKYRN